MSAENDEKRRSAFPPPHPPPPPQPTDQEEQDVGPDPALSGIGGRRVLLIIYIHGFMGKDSSFQMFPAHVHDFLKVALDTHVIHTKIYPRYKTYKAIDVARDNFSKWLAPHESPMTDIVLVGHSMGGLLAADTVLLLPHQDSGEPWRRRHRILGVLALDSPFLGLHPGIIAAGIASLFRKQPDPERAAARPLTPDLGGPASSVAASQHSDPTMDLTTQDPAGTPTAALSYFPSNNSLSQYASLGNHSSNPDNLLSPNNEGADPYYNPPFFNDVMFKDRGWMRNMWHFAKKRKVEGSSLIEAATNHIVCHLQFGKCLADHRGLKDRYARLRRLEDVEDISAPGDSRSVDHGERGREARVRFVNYYTISTGRAKTSNSRSTARSPSRTPILSTANSPGHSSSGSPVRLSRPGSPLRAMSPQPVSDSEHGQQPNRYSKPELGLPPSTRLSRPEQLVANIAVWPPGSTSSTPPRISVEDHSDSARPLLLESIYSGNIAATPRAPDASPNVVVEDQTTVGSRESTSTSSGTEAGSPATHTVAHDCEDIGSNPQSSPASPVDLSAAAASGGHQLTQISDLPEAPQKPMLQSWASDELRKLAEKEYKRALKEYDHGLKAHEKAIKERDKAVEKQRRREEKDAQKKEKAEQKKEKEEQKRHQHEERRRQKEENKKGKEKGEQTKVEAEHERDGPIAARGGEGKQEEQTKPEVVAAREALELRLAAERVVVGTTGIGQQHQDKHPGAAEKEKPKKLRKFCTLPKKVNGVRDPTWVEVFMEGVDEIGAHTGLFFATGPHYEKLVGDVGSRILEWVYEDASRRAILEPAS